MASRSDHPPSSDAGQRGPATSSFHGRLTYAEAASQNAPAAEQSSQDAPASVTGSRKRKHRAGKKRTARRNRRQSFAAPSNQVESPRMDPGGPSLLDVPDEVAAARSSFYRLGQAERSSTSLDSQALLDHRDTGPLQARRQSIQQSFFGPRPSQPYIRPSLQQPLSETTSKSKLPWTSDEQEDDSADDRTPLIPGNREVSPSRTREGYGGLSRSFTSGAIRGMERSGRRSNASSRSSRKRRAMLHPSPSRGVDFDVNNPPSVPGSPTLSPESGFNDVMLTNEVRRGRSPDGKRRPTSRDAIIDIDSERLQFESSPPTPSEMTPTGKRQMHPAEADVCFPQEEHEDYLGSRRDIEYRPRRRRARQWPELVALEDWATEEKEQRTMEGIRVRKVSEPLMIGGRLRPQKTTWHREDEDAPYRFTYFNEEFEGTIHSQTISELLQPGQTFRDLFIPDPPVLSDDSSDGGDIDDNLPGADVNGASRKPSPLFNSMSRDGTRQSSRISDRKHFSPNGNSGRDTPMMQSQTPKPKQRYGDRPVFWLDVLQPTEAEMRVISRTFGIHALTAEDILMQEAREKVELFRNYYFVNYRTFEQDTNSEDYLEPVNMYFVIFREGVLSFHFSMTPHPANVRRRIRQLRDYLILSSDWISYALIDDITDAYAPLIQKIEDEVDDIDDAILNMHSSEENLGIMLKYKGRAKDMEYEKQSDAGDGVSGDPSGDMLRRTGECRRKVMSLYRLLGNKADVIKGFAKRCNEQWEIAPRSEIGLYLGDIQDHIVTMTGNLSHYENLLSRAHSNYLAQINIRMNERAEKTNDVLGKLTVLGTIVLPMNIVTGMWGMNVLVPGQDIESLWWFWGITAGLFTFGFVSYFIAKRTYGIV